MYAVTSLFHFSCSGFEERICRVSPSASARSPNITQIVYGAVKTVGLTPSQTRGSRPGRPFGSYNWRKVQSFHLFFSDSYFSEGLTKKSKWLQKLTDPPTLIPRHYPREEARCLSQAAVTEYSRGPAFLEVLSMTSRRQNTPSLWKKIRWFSCLNTRRL